MSDKVNRERREMHKVLNPRDAHPDDSMRISRRMFVHRALGTGMAVGAGVTGWFPIINTMTVAHAADMPFSFAWISDTHLYPKSVNTRFVDKTTRAAKEVQAMQPAADFLIFGGDIAQLGQAEELELGNQILQEVKIKKYFIPGEHDWYFDMGHRWNELFGAQTYSFDHKGVHFVVLMSVEEKDFWTARGMSPAERMHTVAGLDNAVQSAFEVGSAQREWLLKDLEKVPTSTPLIVFSHSPLYKLYRPWNFWTDDAEDVQALLQRFDRVTVLHGHTHQVLTNRIGNIQFHGMLSTAWPWPYAPQGLPALTVQMNRPNPFDSNDGLGDGTVTVHPDGLVDKLYSLWNRNPMQVKASYLSSGGKSDVPVAPTLASY